jgi:uracil permease
MEYLPNDRPPLGQTILLGLQHVITMFPATVLVALLTGFHVSTVLFACGLATIVALILSKWKLGKFIPLFYGSSFSYIAATLAITNASYGQVASDNLIGIAQAGIVVTGLLNIGIGFLVMKLGGKDFIDRILPPIITGSTASVIGFALAFAALNMCFGSTESLIVAFVTLVSTILFSVVLKGKGFIGMIPVLLGAICGYVIAIPLELVNFDVIANANLLNMPHFTLPIFNDKMSLSAIISIAIMAIATIPESTAHLYQISMYVDHVARKQGKEKYGLEEYAGFNLFLDGLGDLVNGLIGGVAGTNYGENNSLMAISGNYSGVSLIAAGLIAIILSFVGVFEGLILSVPVAVSGGLAVYLFGVIGMQGIALLIENKVDMFDAKNLSVGAVIFIVGIGGHIGYEGGFLPIPLLQAIFPNGWPAIATGVFFGVVLLLLLNLTNKED